MIAAEEQHATAVIAAYNQAGANAFDIDDIPSPLPAFYTTVFVQQMYGGTERGSGERDTTDLYRVVAITVGRTVTNARILRTRVRALEGSTLTIGGIVSTPITFETADLIGPDDGWYSGRVQQTYVL